VHLRMGYLDSLAEACPDLEEQAGIGMTAETFRAILNQHSMALAVRRQQRDVELTDLFGVLKIRDDEVAEGRLEEIMEGLKL
jgi:hypothetical protein